MPRQKSRTDWTRVRQQAESSEPIPFHPEDGPYDPNDEQAVARYWERAVVVRRRGERGPQKAPTKEMISIRLSPEVLEYFRSTGEGWQTRIDEVLKNSVKRKRSRGS